ncbi:MAG: hypothetical protein R8M45_11235, partial [Ghiorsea sp.]
MKMTLPIKFSLISLIVALVSLSFVALFTFKASEKLLNEQGMIKINESVHLSTRLFDYRINQITKDLHLLVNSTEMEGFVQGNNQDSGLALEHLFSTILNQHDMYFQIRLIGIANRGRELLRTY